MNYINSDFLVGEFQQGVGKGFHGSIHIAFDDDVELLEFPDRNSAPDFIEGDAWSQFLSLSGVPVGNRQTEILYQFDTYQACFLKKLAIRQGIL